MIMKSAALVAAFLLGPVTASAATDWMDMSAFGSTNNLVNYMLKHTELINLYYRPAGSTFGTLISTVRDDGTNTIHTIALNGQSAFAATVQRLVASTLNRVLVNGWYTDNTYTNTFVIGFSATWRSISDYPTLNQEFTFRGGGLKNSAPTVVSSNFTVNLGVAATFPTNKPIFVPLLSSAELSLQNAQGITTNTYATWNTLRATDPLIKREPDGPYLLFSTPFVVNPSKCDLRLYYFDGREEVRDLQTGAQLIAYKSPPSSDTYLRFGSTKRVGTNLLLTFESADNWSTEFQRSTNLVTWSIPSVVTITPAPPSGTKTSTMRVRTATVPLSLGKIGFFRVLQK